MIGKALSRIVLPLLLAFGLFLLPSCEREESYYFNPSTTEVELKDGFARQTDVFLNSNYKDITAKVSNAAASWLGAVVYQDVLTVSVTDNRTLENRIGTVSVTAGGKSVEVTVIQPFIEPEPEPEPEPEEPVKKPWPYKPLIGLWNHDLKLDVSDLVEQLGVNCIWTGDNMVTSDLKWESSHLYRSLSVEGVDYVIAKVNRVAWGWTHAGSLSHAAWACRMAKEHEGIVGLYLNDFYDEVEEGYRTENQWREIIAKAREVNPDLPIWVPVYPHRQQQDHGYDFDFDGVIVNMFGNKPEQIASLEKHIYEGLEKFPDKWVVAGVYLESGATGQERWLSIEDFRKVMTFYVKLLNEGKIEGIRMFNANLFLQKPEYIKVAREIIDTIQK